MNDKTVTSKLPMSVTAQSGILSQKEQSSIVSIISDGKYAPPPPPMPDASIILPMMPWAILNIAIISSKPHVTAAFARTKRRNSLKICSGRFERNANYKHVRFGKMMRFSSPTAFMAQKKEVVDEAYAGDIIGLPDTGNFKIGDTLTAGEELHFKGLPSFSPEMFKYIENADPMKAKQLNKGIEQLMDEGVAQLFVNQFNGRKIIGTVGQLQFEVIQYRLLHEYAAQCKWEPISLYKACWIESDNQAALDNFKRRKAQYMALDKEGRDVYLADSGYVLSMAQQDFPDIKFHFTSEF